MTNNDQRENSNDNMNTIFSEDQHAALQEERSNVLERNDNETDSYVTEQPPTNEIKESFVPYAGFWLRFWAYLFDLAVGATLSAILITPFRLSEFISGMSIGEWTLVGAFSSLILYIYFILMTKYFNQTLGKMVFGIRVHHLRNKELSWLDVFFREGIGRLLHRFTIIANVLYLIVPFANDKRGLHDRLGHTFVGIEPRKGRMVKKY